MTQISSPYAGSEFGLTSPRHVHHVVIPRRQSLMVSSHHPDATKRQDKAGAHLHVHEHESKKRERQASEGKRGIALGFSNFNWRRVFRYACQEYRNSQDFVRKANPKTEARGGESKSPSPSLSTFFFFLSFHPSPACFHVVCDRLAMVRRQGCYAS